MPEREGDYLTSATRLLEKRREMAEVDQALAAQKEEFQMKMESLQQRQEELERKESMLKESLLKFDKFLNENDVKKNRALRKANAERDLQKVKDTEIEKLQDELHKITKRRDALLKRLDRDIVFQKYLFKICEVSEFHEIHEVTARYDTLTTTHEDLMQQSQLNQEKIETEKKLLMQYTEEKNNEILHCNNSLATLQTRLDKAQSNSVKWESKWAHIKNTAAQKTLMLGRIKMAVHNLYLVVDRHSSRHDEGVGMEDFNEQLTRVQQYIADLTEITAELRRQEVQLISNIGSSSI
jgi:hypothetical protein